ncbi:MAG TPA: group II intron reverse transcriptase/maturase [Candidatus Limnocylindrales bacterium]|jgi:RNA-directed DNA polymerase|nr:group II intron reverse transcriptase/maturase [Candidatus Limnocylindrales bacterium]
MGDKRQKNQLQMVLAFTAEGRSEAPMARREGTESLTAKRACESPAIPEQVMEEVCERGNLKRALRRVKSNKGSPGIDGMTVGELPGYLKQHWPAIREQLLSGSYKPQPVRRVEIPKPDGGMRKLGIPTVLDRFIQQAVMQILQSKWDGTFSEHSHGFRPGRSAHQAVAKAQQYVRAGRRWVVDLDLEKFFDRVNHDRLMKSIALRIADQRMLRLMGALLKAGVMENGLVSPVDEGTPQGGPLSPLLSNLVLDELDRELERRGHRFVRYADDCNIYVRSVGAGRRVMESITRFIRRRLKLKVNESKSAVARPAERKFLGFSISNGEESKRCIAPKALLRCKRKIRELTRRTRGVSLERMVKELASYLRGWKSYFGFCETPSVLHRLDQWIRRRLRSVIWKQRKRRASWRLANSPVLSAAFPIAYFDSLGVPRLSEG